MDVIDDIESDVARSGKAIFFLRGVGTPCVVAIVTRTKTDLRLFDYGHLDDEGSFASRLAKTLPTF